MRCADVAVEEKVVDAVAAVEVERVAAGVARETMTGQREKFLADHCLEDQYRHV